MAHEAWSKSISRRLLAIAFPVMGENLLQSFLSMVDTYLVAQLGLTVVSGVALASNILAVYQAVFIAVGAVVSAAIAKSQSLQERQKQVAASLTITVWIGLVLGCLSLGFGPILLASLGAEAELLETGALYLSLVGGTSLLMGLMLTLGSSLRAQGRPRFPLVVSILANVLNVLLSATLVFVLGWGVVGVALGTVVSRAIGVLLLCLALPDKPRVWSWKLDKPLLLQLLPAAGERLMMRLGDLVVIGLVATLGVETLAGYTIGETLTQFNYLPAMSLAVATVILAAQEHQKTEPLTKIIWTSYGLSIVGMLLIAGLVFLSQIWLIGAYTNQALPAHVASQVILVSLLGIPVTAGTLVSTALWQGIGQAKHPFYATALGMWLVRIGLSAFGIMVLKLGLWPILLAQVADNAFRTLYLSIRYSKTIKEK